MKRILFLSTLEANKWGGSEQLWSDMALLLLANGYKVMTNTISWKEKHEKLREIEAAGSKLSFRPNPHNPDIKLTEAALNKLKTIKWKNEVIAFDPDVIVISQGGTFDFALHRDGDWLMSLDKPMHIISQFIDEYDVITETERVFFKKLFSTAENVWFVSNRNKQVAERTLAKKIDNGIVVRNPIKINNTVDTYPNTGIYKFAAVARLDSMIKGYDILATVFAEPQWAGRNYLVNIYGSGRDEQYLRDLVSYCNLDGHFQFRGFTDNILNIWEENHMLLMPSRGEGTPLALLEASYCKRAAVVTDVGGNAEIVTDEHNGFVADAPTVRSFSNALESAWKQKDNWEQMGLNAKERIDELYATDAVEEAVKLLGL